MSNRKKILLLCAVIILLAGIAFLAWHFNSSKNSQQQPNSPTVFNFNGNGAGLTYDKTSKQVLQYNAQTERTAPIATITGPTPFYLELSPDQNSLLYTTDPNENEAATNSNPDAENLIIRPVKTGVGTITKENIFSPHWLDSKKIVYQLLPPDGNGKLIVQDIAAGKIVQQIDIGDQFSEEIYVLDSDNVIVNQYASDVGETSSHLVNLPSTKVSAYLNGNGLKFKTVPGSQYVAYQIIGDDGTATSKLINWQTKTSVLEINDPLDNLIWTKNGQDAYFAKGGQIIKHSLTTGSETKIATVTPPVLAFEIAGEKSLFIETQVSPQVININ